MIMVVVTLTPPHTWSNIPKWQQQNHYLDTVNGDPWTLLYCDISGVCTEFSSGVGASGVVTYTVSF